MRVNIIKGAMSYPTNDNGNRGNSNMEESRSDRPRGVTVHQIEKRRWLCLGDVRPHFETLKSGLESDTEITTEGSTTEDCVSDEDELCFSSNSNDKPDPVLEYFHKTPHHSYVDELPLHTRDGSVSSLLLQKRKELSDDNANATKRKSAVFRSHPVSSLLATSNHKPCLVPSMNSCTCSGGSSYEEDSIPSDIKSSSTFLGISSLCSKRRCLHRNRYDCSLPSRNTSCTINKRRNVVTLHEYVSVIPIPSREEYSQKVKERLWSSFAEMSFNAARNAIEFAAEGWNWRNVMEDEAMLMHQGSGELIHPIHLQNVLATMAANKEADCDLACDKSEVITVGKHNQTNDGCERWTDTIEPSKSTFE